MTQARVLYDFEAQAEFGEINLKVGEIVSVISEDAGEGWWRGTNVNGEQGLFPKDFVEKFDPNEDATKFECSTSTLCYCCNFPNFFTYNVKNLI